MSEKVKIFIVDDHKLFREGLKSILGQNDKYEVVGESGDGLQAIHDIRSQRPDLMLLDFSMPRMNGISVIAEARRLFPTIKILMLTINDSTQNIRDAFSAGANGYCAKHSSLDELMTAIESVIEGKTYISPEYTHAILQGFITGGRVLNDDAPWESVTRREREVLKMLAEGYKNKEIAELLCISIKTVATHRANIMNKLDLHNLAALTAFAIEKGLVEPKA